MRKHHEKHDDFFAFDDDSSVRMRRKLANEAKWRTRRMNRGIVAIDDLDDFDDDFDGDEVYDDWEFDDRFDE